MIRALITAFAALAGLAFGSFLNVCLSRWPAGESIVKPRSHCRTCRRTLTWWENIPLLSWLALGGRCRTCKSAISWRYPAVELLVGVLWAISAWHYGYFSISYLELSYLTLPLLIVGFLGPFALLWLLVALAALDAENLWLPDKLTLPGIFGGVFVAALYSYFFAGSIVSPITLENFFISPYMRSFWRDRILAILAAAFLILAIRWLYWLIRRREGIGLGDAKLMALLAAWLGLPGALLAFALGVVFGSVVGVVVLVRGPREGVENPALAKLPLGTFLCIGGIVASLWGQPILAAYMRYSGLN
ncbi:MAG: prepilin peptidase [Acidobacteriaceae bacterium]|nr:prepilin peptidase [Acidobacteriaceae bacterium]